MIQIIPRAEFNVLWTLLGCFGNVLGGYHDVFNTDTFGADNMRIPIPIAGTFRNMTLYSGEGRALSFGSSVWKNNGGTGLVAFLPIAGGASQVSNTIDTVAIAPGDDVAWVYGSGVSFGAPGKTTGLTVEWEGDELIFGMAGIPGAPAATHCYMGGALGNGIGQFVGLVPANGVPSTSSYSICPISGRVKHLVIKENHGGNAGGSWTVYLRVNNVLQDGTGGTVNTAVTLADGGGFAVGAIELPLVFPDHVEYVVLRNGTNAVGFNQPGVGLGFLPDNTDQFIVVGGNNNSNTAAFNTFTWNTSRQQETIEALASVAVGQTDFFLQGLYIEFVGQTPGHSFTFLLTLDGVSTGISVTIDSGSGPNVLVDGFNVLAPAGSTLALALIPSDAAALIGELHWALIAGFAVVPPSCPGVASVPRIDGLPFVPLP